MMVPPIGRIIAAFILLSAFSIPASAHVWHHHIRHHKRVHHVRHVRRHVVFHVRHVRAPVQYAGEHGNAAYWQRERARVGNSEQLRGPVERVGAAIGNSLIAEARRFVGRGNPTGFRGPWCGAFAALVARRTGYLVPHGYLQARQWVHAGRRLPGPRPGVYAVRQHHVALVESVHGHFVTLINGNFRNRVAESFEPASRFFAFVAPVRG